MHFSQDVRLGIVEAAERTGSTITIDDKLPKELNDMAATLSKVKATKSRCVSCIRSHKRCINCNQTNI